VEIGGSTTAITNAHDSTYIVQAADAGCTFTVTVTRSDNIGSVTSDPTDVVIAANQYPAATDFDIGNLTQTAGQVTPVTITPKPGKSNGTQTVYYAGTSGTTYAKSTTVPQIAGTYTVTFDIATVQGWYAVTGLVGGTLQIYAQIAAQTPVITGQPANATVTINAPHSLSVGASASDGGTLSYQWYSNTSASNNGGTAITGAVNSTYNPPTDTAGTYFYFVEVINTITYSGDSGNKTASVRSNAVTLTVNTLVNAQTPAITSQSVGTTVVFNAPHRLSVLASVTDGGTLSYQWYSNTSLSNSGGTHVTWATSAAYNPPTGTAGTYYYFVEVTNTITDNGDGGNKTASGRSNAVTLTVNAQVNAQTPAIINQPVGATVAVGASHSLSVTANATDSGTLSYRWYSNTSLSNSGGTPVTGATSAVYNPPTGTVGTYFYFVEVTNTITNNGDGGNKTASSRSNAVEIRVLSPSGIVIDLTRMNEWELTEQTAIVTANVNKIFTVTGTYTTYHWYLDGTQVGTSSSYTFNKSGGVYHLAVIVTNSSGESRSGRCRITIASPLTANLWVDGSITDADSEDWYSCPVTSGTTYYFWWNDRKQGNGTKNGDVAVSAQYENETTFIFGGTDTGVDNGWTTEQLFTANQTGTVYIRVIPYDRNSGNAGAYGIVYNTSGTRPSIYTVTFSANNGTGTVPATRTVTAGSSIILPGGSGLSRSGYTFSGWNTNTSGTGTNYNAGASYTPTANITLYARWTIPLTANVWANGTLSSASGEIWYSLSVSSGTTYHIWWNDKSQGNGSKTGTVAVGARYENTDTFIFGGTNNTVLRGWDTVQSFTATQTGTVYIRVIPYNRDSYYIGTFGIVYSTGSIRPAL
jgi:uncharacterized repeat protein (TIGR02543 family)